MCVDRLLPTHSYFRAYIIAQLDRLSYKNRVCFSQASKFFYQDGRRFIYSGELIIPAIWGVQYW
jgi:hypothetical protein